MFQRWSLKGNKNTLNWVKMKMKHIKMKIEHIKMGWRKSSGEREICSTNAYFRTEEMPLINNLSSYLKKLEKKSKIKPRQAENRK